MTKIPLVGGNAITADQLGFTLIHEHLRTETDGVRFQWPDLYDDKRQFDRAMEEVTNAMQHGVRTICDPTVLGLGRDARFMERVVKESGAQVVAATGLYTYRDLPHYFENRSIDFMADLFVRDITMGIQGTNTKAGFIKFATDEPGITPGVDKVIRAAARAHRQTGVPIITHSHAHNGSGLDQIALLEKEDADLSHVVIGHVGDTDNLEYLTAVLKRGVFIGLDRYGLDIYLPTEKRNKTVVTLIDQGYVGQLLLSQDACATIDWFEPEEVAAMVPNWSMSYIPETILPTLKASGVTDDQIHTMMVENPRRLFDR
ncbi:MAG: phosphotriesterase-related protein [Firmicutes bacterium]|nr:phosphotriesterase-related protein [Bacillota bacterium]